MNQIKKNIADQIVSFYDSANLSLDNILEIFDTPPDPSMGDLALACFKLSKVLRKSPVAIAGELAEAFTDSLPNGIAKIENAGGYLNFFLADSYRVSILRNMLELGTDYGRNEIGKGLCRVGMSAVTRIYNRHGCIRGSNEGRTLKRVAHSDYINVTANNAGCIGNSFALGCGRIPRIGKADNVSAKLHHCRFEAQSGAR